MGIVLASATERSRNQKISHPTSGSWASITNASQQSCPDCALKGAGCYAENGHAAYTTRRLNRSGPATPLQIAQAEASAIDRLSGRYPLRLRGVGDNKTNAAARVVSESVARYIKRGGQKVWGYTHAWRNVDVEAFGRASIVASCDSVGDIPQANAHGYPAALVVPQFTTHKRNSNGVKGGVPCLQQTGGTAESFAVRGGKDRAAFETLRKVSHCIPCGLCFNAAGLLKTGTTILFEAHGNGGGGLGKLRESIAQRAGVQHGAA